MLMKDVIKNETIQVKDNAARLTKDEVIRMQLREAENGLIETKKGTLLNDYLLGRSKKTKISYKIPSIVYKRDPVTKMLYKTMEYKVMSENKLFRQLDSYEVIEKRIAQVPLKNGEIITATVESSYRRLKGDPIMFVKMVGEPMSTTSPDWDAHNECVEFSKKGIPSEVLKELGFEETDPQEPAASSSSGMRTLNYLFVKENFRFQESYLARFKPKGTSSEEMKAFKNFMDMMKGLRGMEVILTMLTDGAYLQSYKDKKSNLSKFLTRAGLGLSATKSMGNDFKVGYFGKIRIPWADWIEKLYRDYLESRVSEKSGARLLSDTTIDRIIARVKDTWKEDKWDGMSIISDEAVIRGFKKIGIKLTPEQVIGEAIQDRLSGKKGMSFVCPKSWIWNFTLPDGTKPFYGKDIIAEANSVKFRPWEEWWTGEAAPELGLITMSSSKHSNSSNYQYWNALDGISAEQLIAGVMGSVDKVFDGYMAELSDPLLAKAACGIKSINELAEDDSDIDTYERSLTTNRVRALDADPRMINERSWALKYVNSKFKAKERMAVGTLPLRDAGYAHLMADPMAFFLCKPENIEYHRDKDGNIVKNPDGTPMFDIVIRSIEDLAIRNPYGVHWGGYEGDMLLFRSPCIHPGEPQKVNGISNSAIQQPSGVLAECDAKWLYSRIKNLIITSGLSYTLDAMGGADVDGDESLGAKEEEFVSLRDIRRPPALVKISTKEELDVIGRDTIRKFIARSLVYPMIGIITNQATTWRDAELAVKLMPNPKTGKYRLPYELKEELNRVAKEARKILRSIEKGETDITDELILDSLNRTASMKFINLDDKYDEWSKAVILACEANLMLLRRLQEEAIATPKTGVPVDIFKYPWLCLRCRASWHRPNAKIVYESWSTLGRMESYVNKKWEEFNEWIKKNTAPIHLDIDVDWAGLKDVYDAVRALKLEFGPRFGEIVKSMYKDGIDDDDKKEAMRKMKDLSSYYRALLRALAERVGSITEMTALVYRATYDLNTDADDGFSFLWHCWGDEFVDTLYQLNNGKPTERLVVARMDPKYKDYVLKSGMYHIENGNIMAPDNSGEVLAHAKVPDGEHRIIRYNENIYVVLNTIQKKTSVVEANIAGIPLPLIGFPYREYEGKKLTRDKVKELLALSDYVVTFMAEECNTRKGKAVRTVAKVCLEGSDEFITLGNLPDAGDKNSDIGYLAKALHNKLVRVEIPRDADKTDRNKKDGSYSKLTIVVTEVLLDLSLEDKEGSQV